VGLPERIIGAKIAILGEIERSCRSSSRNEVVCAVAVKITDHVFAKVASW
jgi:hypothetical protein